MYGKGLISVHARFEGDSDRFSDPGGQGQTRYTEKIWFPYSMRGEIDAYLTDYNWAAALANFFSNTGNSDISNHLISWRWFAV